LDTPLLTPIKTLPITSLPANAHSDGATLVADINNDGQLDIIVVSKKTGVQGNSYIVVYVWTPNTMGNGGSLIGRFTVSSTSEYYGIPTIGNIDDSPYPEIVFLGTSNKMYALKYNLNGNAGNKITKKWELDVANASACTGMSLFDFDLDGKNEIVYRDPTSLRIIDGSGTSAIVNATFSNIHSGAMREFPVVADIDNDGRAEIITTGHTSTLDAQNGYLRIFLFEEDGTGDQLYPDRDKEPDMLFSKDGTVKFPLNGQYYYRLEKSDKTKTREINRILFLFLKDDIRFSENRITLQAVSNWKARISPDRRTQVFTEFAIER
jgi:hypothetical protein